MKALKQIVAPAVLSVGLAFGGAAAAQQFPPEVENGLELGECSSAAVVGLMREQITQVIDDLKNNVEITPEQEMEFAQKLEQRGLEAVRQCAAEAAEIPLDQVPSVDSPEFEDFMNQNFDQDAFDYAMELGLTNGMFELLPLMMEMEMLEQSQPAGPSMD